MEVNLLNQNPCMPSRPGIFQFDIFYRVALSLSECTSPEGLFRAFDVVYPFGFFVVITVTSMFQIFLVLCQGTSTFLFFRFLWFSLYGLPGRQSLLLNRFSSFFFFSFLLLLLLLTISTSGRLGGARGVVVIVVGNGHGDTSSNPGPDWLHFT